MPHKHKRKHTTSLDDKADFDLPPEKRATPLSVHKPKAESWEGFDAQNEKKSNKRREPNKDNLGNSKDGKLVKDDTPKNFARLMAWQSEGRKLRKGLDDGDGLKARKKGQKEDGKEKGQGQGKGKGGKKTRDIAAAMAASVSDATMTQPLPSASKLEVEQRRDPPKSTPAANTDSSTEAQPHFQPQSPNSTLKIKPGERLADFSLRVDQSLPLSSIHIPKHGTKDRVLGLKTGRTTKHNKHIQRMQTEWRNAGAKIKAKKEEDEDERADQREEEGLLWMDVESARARRKGKKKKRKAGEVDDADPWKVLERKRKEPAPPSAGGLRASDTVQAPPTLKPVKNMFREPQDRRLLPRGIKA